MLLSLALILLTGLLFSGILNRFKLPGLLGMMIAGMVLGPNGLNWIHPSILTISKELRQLALIIILMRAGLSMDLEDLRRIGKPAFLMTFVPASFELIAITLLGPLLLHLSILDSAILGAVLAAVSPAVVVPRMLKLMDENRGTEQKIPHLIMAGASVDDVYVIVLFTAFVAMAQGKGLSIAQFIEVPFSLITGIVGGFLVGVLLIKLFKQFHMRDTVKVLVLLSASFLLVTFESSMGNQFPFSAYIAIMAMGVSILQRYGILAARISGKFNKAWVAAELLLFVLVGAAVDIRTVHSAGLNSILLIFLALGIRMIGVSIALIPSKLNLKEKLFCGVAYLPKATVQAAIGGIPLSLGLASGNVILSVAVLAILISAPLGAILMDYFAPKLLTQKKEA